jgi:hypothetical protein
MQRQPGQILAVEVQQVELEIDEISGRIAVALQRGEGRRAVRHNRAKFAVDIGLAAFERADRGGDLRIFGDQMKLLGANVLDPQPGRRFSKIRLNPSDRRDVELLRRMREIADRHVFDHALSKRACRSHWAVGLTGVDVTITSSQSAGFSAAIFLLLRRSRFVRSVAGSRRNSQPSFDLDQGPLSGPITLP